MAKKQKLKNNKESEKTLALAGTLLTILAVVSSIYYWYVNQRFITDVFPSLIYYISYVVIMGGGFAVGYLLTRKASVTTKLLAGSTYALLAMSLYDLVSAMNFVIGNAFMVPYPWGAILFNGAPLLALVATIIIGLLVRFSRNSKTQDTLPKRTFIGLFLAAQLYNIGNIIYWAFFATGGEPSDTPLILTIAAYVLNPLTIMVVAYLVLGRIKGKTSRLFYAAFIGSFVEVLSYSLWNFRTDPSADATNVFSEFVVVIIALAVGLLLLKVHRKA